MGEFFVRVPEATEMSTAFASDRMRLDEDIAALSNRISQLIELSSFTGEGAEAIKSYFSEVHLVLLDALDSLAGQLELEYACYYSDLLDAAEGDRTGSFPSSDMEYVKKRFQGFASGDIPQIDSLLREALKAAPAGYAFSTPQTAYITTRLNESWQRVGKVRQAVEDAEQAGKSSLAGGDALCNKLMSQLSQALSRCSSGKVSMASYQPGEFRSVTMSLGLRDAVAQARQEQDACADFVVETKQQAISNWQNDLADERARAAAEKEKFAGFGLALQTVILGAAIAALCVATGGIAVAFGVVAVAGAAYGWNQRSNQLAELKKGNAGADIDDEDIVASTLESAGDLKDPLDGLEKIGKNNDIYKGVVSSGMSKDNVSYYSKRSTQDVVNIGVGVVSSFAIDKAADRLDETVGDKLEGDDKLAYDEGKKVGKKVVQKGVDKVTDKLSPRLFEEAKSATEKGVSKGAGYVGLVAECVQIYTDYEVDKNDKIIDECDEGLKTAEKLRNGVAIDGHPAIAAAW